MRVAAGQYLLVYAEGCVGLEVREPTISDLDRCIAQLASAYMCDPSNHAHLRTFWLEIITARSGVAVVVVDSADPTLIVQFGFMVFVTDRQAEEYHRCAQPLIARRLLAQWIAGERPFLDRAQIARANAGPA